MSYYSTPYLVIVDCLVFNDTGLYILYSYSFVQVAVVIGRFPITTSYMKRVVMVS